MRDTIAKPRFGATFRCSQYFGKETFRSQEEFSDHLSEKTSPKLCRLISLRFALLSSLRYLVFDGR